MLDQTTAQVEPPSASTAIIPRATVRDMVIRRQAALDLFDSYHTTLEAAAGAGDLALQAFARLDQRGREDRYTHHTKGEEGHFLNGIKPPTSGDFRETARKMIDRRMWAVIIELTDLERLMDKKAKDELYQQIRGDQIIEATEENILATLQQFMLDADTIFKRGIANCFAALDRRFRSHDGWKIGSRVILTYAFNEWGSWNYNFNKRDTMHDIDRTFHVLDGKDNPSMLSGIVNIVDQHRRSSSRVHQSMHESEYFRIRCYQNGNAHIWFKRDDLVEKVNKLLGEYYNAGIPQEREPDEDTGLDRPKTSLAKNYGFFPTPDRLADTVIEAVKIYKPDDRAALTLLEPSAGTGALAGRAAKAGAIVDCVEYQPELARQLADRGDYRRVWRGDFLTLPPEAVALYDRVAMNPPFDRERDIDHVMHALKFLKPNGFLVAVMSASTEYRETKKSKAFRALMESMNARWRDLPAGSFVSAGTNVNTILLGVYKDGRKQNHW